MGSVNISITEEVYEMLKSLRKKDESFSELIGDLVRKKDISTCFGLLKSYSSDLAVIEREALRSRKQPWRGVDL